MSEQPGRYQRSFGGLVGALVVLLLVMVGFVVFRELNRDDPADPVEAVDFRTTASFAKSQARFPLLVPRNLPDGWTATSVRFTEGSPQTWHLGTLTDQERYVGLEQADRPAGDMVERHVDADAERGGDVSLAGQTWTTWTDAGGDLALVREDDGVTTVVVGRVSQDTLAEFMATLR